MKKTLMATFALFFTLNLAMAQSHDDSKPQPAATPGVEAATTSLSEAPATKCDVKNCCVKKDGKMVRIKDGVESAMVTDLTMADGTVIMKDGTCIGKDGKKMMMKDGDCIDMNGRTCVMSHQNGGVDADPKK